MANKSTTIKTATDKELDELLIRLRKENELQNLIGYIKRKSGTIDPLDPYAEPKVSTEEPIDSMYHFGIPGMRWGRRSSKLGDAMMRLKKRSKGPSPVSNSSGKKKVETSSDHQTKVSLKSKKLSQMTNTQLRAFNERMQLERQFKDLTRSEISPGRKFVTDILVGAAKQTATSYISKYMGKGVEQLIKRSTGQGTTTNPE